ncbi:MAG: AAA family ATPase, partial [Hyphomicrobiaceae bacterium]
MEERVAQEPGVDERQQAEAIAFLRRPGALAPPSQAVQTISTHGAIVFLAGGHAYKIKRAVRFPYMDFSTLEKRKAALERELEINRPNAPRLYVGLLPLTRCADGEIALDGQGEEVEWVLKMRRFDQACLLSHIAGIGGISPDLAKGLADAVVAAHASAPVAKRAVASRGLLSVVEELEEAFARLAELGEAAGKPALMRQLRGRLMSLAPLLEERARAGLVRRCHGDLHLNNIVLIEGRPVLFDALEFDEDLATIDLFYDLAFLLMDLDARGLRPAANLVLNRYIWLRNEPLDLDGLGLLPLFLALRAAIRAMIGMGRLAELSGKAREEARREAQRLVDAAEAFLAPPPPRLVAVGGLSGTGKSTLAAALAARFGAAPGALHLRSDLERKSLAGASETSRLPAAGYTQETTARVYSVLADKAKRALSAGHSVIVDAVFSREEERAAIEAVARDCSVPFNAIWLATGSEALLARVAARRGDASDATPDVVERQLARGAGEVKWTEIDAGG